MVVSNLNSETTDIDKILLLILSLALETPDFLVFEVSLDSSSSDSPSIVCFLDLGSLFICPFLSYVQVLTSMTSTPGQHCCYLHFQPCPQPGHSQWPQNHIHGPEAMVHLEILKHLSLNTMAILFAISLF